MRIQSNKAIKAELTALYARHGKLTDQLVVSASKAKGSALHPLFYWGDDKRAAHVGRLEIARTLIASVTVVYDDVPGDGETVTVREYHGVGGGYRSVDDVVNSKKLLEIVLGRALAEMESLRRKYAHLKQLTGVFDAIDRAVAAHRKPARKPARRRTTQPKHR